MVVKYPYSMSVSSFPPKDETPTVVDSDAVIPLQVPSEELEAVPRW
jgi:hypothetical protein